MSEPTYSGSRLSSCLLAVSLLSVLACSEPTDSTEASNTNVASSAQELAAREAAALGIEAQPLDVQERYYQAELMTRQQSAATTEQLVNDLAQQQAKAATARSANGADINKQLGQARAQLAKRQQRVRDLQAKLASF